MKVLLVEDDIHLSQDVSKQLTGDGFVVDVCYDGVLAEKMILRGDYACILLDVNIPGKNGLEVCKSIRAKDIQTPVIMITSFGELDDKISGFDSGADDYLPKPFYYKELLARIKVISKRNTIKEEGNNYILEDLVVDFNRKRITRAGTEIKLTQKEFLILKTLIDSNGNPVSKQFLMENVWGNFYNVNPNTVEVFINLLRSKIDKNHSVKLIRTKTGFGYYLSAHE